MTTPATDEARSALRASMALDGHPLRKESAVPTPPEQEDQGALRFPSVTVDFKIPLPWLLSGAGVLLWGLIAMYFQLRGVSESVDELKASVKTNNVTTIQFAQEQAILKFRVEKLEAEQARADRK